MDFINLLEVYNNLVVLDIETSGVDVSSCEILEISLLKVSGGKIIDRFSSLIKPSSPVPSEVTEITHITNKMLEEAPKFDEISNSIKSFIGQNYLLGHNISFDLSFLSLAFNEVIENRYIDTLKLSRTLLPELEHHRLQDLAEYFNIDYSGAHRSERDCEITLECFEMLKNVAIGRFITLGYVKSLPKKKKYSKEQVKAKNVVRSENAEIDENHLLYDKTCVFTGDLKIPRKKAMQIVVDIGGKVSDHVTKKTNIIILGNNNGVSSSKMKKAEQYRSEGQEIQAISEEEFYTIFNI